jgi:urease accessory protein
VSALAFLRGLQLADSSLPVGRYVHSFGLEAVFRHHPALTEEELLELVQSFLIQGVGPIDATAVAIAYQLAGRSDVRGLVELDHAITARKLTPPARLASQSCGRQLALLAPTLGGGSTMSAYCAEVELGAADGNLSVVHGVLANALEVPYDLAVLIELKGCASAVLYAAVRLGRLSASRAQSLLRRCEGTILATLEDALVRSVDDLHSSAVELEIHAMRHARSDAKLFMT